MIYHMLSAATWQAQPQDKAYIGDTLSSEGFIHCTAEHDRLLTVANQFYRNQPGDWRILCIDEDLVLPEVRWEENHGHIFPHIYGPLNLNAVVEVVEFPRGESGEFQLPIVFAKPVLPPPVH